MYLALARIFRRLWTAYGGWPAVISSPYLHIAVVAAYFTAFIGEFREVTDAAITILPNLLGFSIGAYAIVFGIMSEKVIELLASREDGEEQTLLAQLSSSFGYFIIVQAFALLSALSLTVTSPEKMIGRGLMPGFLEFTGFWANFISATLFFYALLLTIGIALEIFRISTFREL